MAFKSHLWQNILTDVEGWPLSATALPFCLLRF